MLHEGGWTVRGSPNGVLEFYNQRGNLVGTTTPHQPAAGIVTTQGRARQRLDKLARRRAAELRAA
jgi:hypothetical protein